MRDISYQEPQVFLRFRYGLEWRAVPTVSHYSDSICRVLADWKLWGWCRSLESREWCLDLLSRCRKFQFRRVERVEMLVQEASGARTPNMG